VFKKDVFLKKGEGIGIFKKRESKVTIEERDGKVK
jgi:hypothetical protein